jgi:hypothetical protein
MSDENFELEVFKTLDKNTNENSTVNPKQKDFPRERFSNITFYILFYTKKSSELIRTILTKKTLDLKRFNKIENKDLHNIKINENIFFFFYNLDKKMIRALMKKDNRMEKISNLAEDELKLEPSNR